MKRLAIAAGLQLPLDWMTLANVVYGARGSGKTTLGAVIAEEVTKAGQRFCAIDLKGDWYGLKSTADGKGEGIPAVIFGGDHADVPLEPEAGAEVASIVAELEQSVILDFELMSKGKQLRFLGPFFERLYHVNRTPLLLELDEVQRYAPQKPLNPEASICLGAVEDIVKLGRKHGIGVVMFTQRGSGLNKEVSELSDMLVAFRTPGPLDQDRIKDWLDANTTKAQRDEVMGQLAGLETGTAVFASGHPGLKIFQVAHVRERETFDSSATPKIGQRKKEPRRLAKPDLAQLSARMAASIERAKQDDPKELRRRIAELEREKRKAIPAPAAAPIVKEVAKRVEVPVLKDGQLKRIEQLAGRLEQFGQRFSDASANLTAGTISVGRDITAALVRLQHPENGHRSPPASRAAVPAPARPVAQRPPTRASTTPPAESGSLTSLQQRILNGLAWLETLGLEAGDRAQVGLIARAKPTGGHYSNQVSALRTQGLLEYPREGALSLTDAGRALAILEHVPKTTQELHQQIFGMVTGLQRKILQHLVRAYPDSMVREDLAAAVDADAGGGHFSNQVSALRTLGVLDYPAKGEVVATPILFLEAGELVTR